MKVKKLLGNQRGSSLVSVITAFVILLMGISMMTAAITAAIRISNHALQVRRSADEAISGFYQGGGTDQGKAVRITIQEDGVPAAKKAQFKALFKVYTNPTADDGKEFLLDYFESTEEKK